MKTRIAASLVLPPVLAMGVITTMLAMGMSTVPKIGAGSVSAPPLVTTIEVRSRPSSIAITSDGTRAFLADGDGSASVVNVIDIATNQIVSTIDDPGFFSLNTIAIAPDNSKAYVLGAGGDFAIDTITSAVKRLPTEGSFGSVAILPDGTKTYIGKDSGADADIFVLDGSSDEIITSITLPGGQASSMAIRPDGTRLYVTDRRSDLLYVIDTINDAIVATVVVGDRPEGVAVTIDGRQAFVANVFSDEVSVVDLASNSVVGTIPVGKGPTEVHFTPDGCLAFVPNISESTVSVIDVATSSVITTFPTFSSLELPGTTEKGIIAFTPDGRQGYLIEGRFPGVVSVFDITGLCRAIDLSITKAGSPDPVTAGANLSYTLTVTHAATGAAAATGVFVTDTLPADVRFQIAFPSQGFVNPVMGAQVVWDVGNLSGGQSETLDIVVTVDPDAISGTTLTNRAVVDGGQPDPFLGNNAVEEKTTVREAPRCGDQNGDGIVDILDVVIDM